MGEKKKVEYKYIVVPFGEFVPAEFGIWLNTFFQTDNNEAYFKLGNIPKNGFYVPHSVLTAIKKSFPDWNKHFELYAERGDRKVRKYSIPDKKDSAKKKKAKTDLKEILRKKAEKK